MKRFALFIFLILTICSPTSVKAQLDSLVYSPESAKLNADGKNELRATVDAMTFFVTMNTIASILLKVIRCQEYGLVLV